MKRIAGLLILSAAIVVGLSMTAVAQNTIVFTGGTESSYGGFGTGLYSGTLNGTSTSFICDDSTHDIANGDTWMANAWSLSQVATPGNGAFAGPPYATATYAGMGYTVQEVYNAVAYLANLIFTNASPDVNGIQYAIWSLMDSPPAGPASTAGWITTGLANDNYTNPNIVFYSPDGNLITSGPDTGKTAQEFIGEVPEPISMVLMGTFLSLAGLLLGKKRLMA